VNPAVKFTIQSKRFRTNLERFGESLEDITEEVANLSLEKARELEEPHIRTGNLYNSLRLEKSEGTKVSSFKLLMGGLATTQNIKGQDYAVWHEYGNSVTPGFRILTRTLEWARSEGLGKAVQFRMGRQ